MALQDSSKVLIGEIQGLHGIKGAVRCRFYINHIKDIEKCSVFVDEHGHEYKVLEMIPTRHRENFILKINNIISADQAEKLRGMSLYVKRQDLPPLQSNEYLYADLIGLKVLTVDEKDYGRIISVHNFGAGDILEVQLKATTKKVLIPFTNDAVPEIDLVKKTIKINEDFVPIVTGQEEKV